MKSRGVLKITINQLEQLHEKLEVFAKVKCHFYTGTEDIILGVKAIKTVYLEAKTDDLIETGIAILKHDCQIEVIEEFQPIERSFVSEFFSYSKENFLQYLGIYGGTLVAVYAGIITFTDIYSAIEFTLVEHGEIWAFSIIPSFVDWVYSFKTFKTGSNQSKKTFTQFVDSNVSLQNISKDKTHPVIDAYVKDGITIYPDGTKVDQKGTVIKKGKNYTINSTQYSPIHHN